MKKTILLFAVLTFLTFKNQAQTVTDYDGNVYDTVTIGAQMWMKENLKVTHYRNGETIPNFTDNTTWGDLLTGGRCYYNNDSAANASVYGALYNWFTVNDSRNLCPIGWHVPTEAEWTTLSDYLGGDSVAGGKMKEIGAAHWTGVNYGATNESGFTALPGGYRPHDDGIYEAIGEAGYWWSATEYNANSAWDRNVNTGSAAIYPYYNDGKGYGFSVRCLSNSPANQINELNNIRDIQIYPNPAIDRVYINCAERQNVKMQVYNMIGEYVLQRELNNGTNIVDISSFPKGIYVVRFSKKNWTIQQKLIKE
ncbi:hypothetical protein ES705_33188 [subsurface metagenome]